MMLDRRLAFALIALLTFTRNAPAAPLPTSARSEAIIAAEESELGPALEAKGLSLGAPVYIAIYKEERVLEVWLEAKSGAYRLYKTYPVCAVSGDLGPKRTEGDRQAPEGFYAVRPAQLVPSSVFDLALGLDYPNAYDKSLGRTGSGVTIHGNCISDSTYAMTDPVIEETYTIVYAALKAGVPLVPVHIFPFRMTRANMARHARSPSRNFWLSLKAGYDAFLASQHPPNISVKDGAYLVSPG